MTISSGLGEAYPRYPAEMTEKASLAIVVLGRDTCEDTTRSRALLVQRRIPFSYRKVDEDAAADAWIRRLNDGRWLTDDPDRRP